MLFFSRNNAPTGPVEYIVAGLGNPGSKYENTRHNAGFLAIERLAEKSGASIDRLKFKGLPGQAEVGGRRVLLLKPSTYMNLSGQSVQEALAFYKLPPSRCIVLFDDISLEPGRMRIRAKGTDGGHNGMKNIIYLTGRDDIPRIKIGVGKKPNPGWDLADWVLSRFSPADLKALDPVLDHAAEAVALIVNGKLQEAQNRFNS